MGAHAKIAPSAAARYLRCPAALPLSEGLGWVDDYGDNTTREQGTAAHWAMDVYAKTGQAPQVGEMAPNGVRIDAEMLEAAKTFVHEVRKLAPGAQFEVKLDMGFAIPDCWGTADAVGTMQDGKVLIADLKYGMRPVEALGNVQLSLYALGAGGVDTGAVLLIYQPRAWHRAGPLRKAAATPPQIEALTRALQDAVANPGRAVPGTHCKQCPGRVRCGALREVALSPIATSSVALDLPTAERELQEVSRHHAVIEAYKDALQIIVQQGLKDGGHATLYELRRKRGALEWQDEASALRLAKIMGVSITKEKIITPTQAAKVLGAETVAQFTKRGEGALSLAEKDPAFWSSLLSK